MMTIRKFASLCGCGTQTLRYYDRIGLLKPIRVDPESGYRYYERSQAIDFVKIKNLQAADFTIDQIRALLPRSDQEIYEAFEQKIAEQSRKLERIKEIQQTYLTEKSNMEKVIHSVSAYLLHSLSDFEVLREFGLNPEEGPGIVETLRDYIESRTRETLPAESETRMLLNGSMIQGADRIADAFDSLKEKGFDDTVLLGDREVGEEAGITPENSETVQEFHGWAHVYEFMGQIASFEAGYEYCFHFCLVESMRPVGIEFPMFMIAAMLPRLGSGGISIGCTVENSKDAENHCLLLRRKQGNSIVVVTTS